jgi:hypothetical protein
MAVGWICPAGYGRAAARQPLFLVVHIVAVNFSFALMCAT